MRWYFNIKKIIISIISIFLCILSVCQFTQAEDDYEIEENLHLVVDNKITSESNFEMSFTIPDMDFYPFIFNHRNEWEISEVLGKTDCSDGYLYSKDLKTGIIRKLVDQKIDNMYETKEGIYFIYGNTLFFVDYLGSSLETIYSSKHGLKKGIIQKYNDSIYLVDNDVLIVLKDNKKTELFAVKEITGLFVIDENDILYHINENTILVDLNKKGYYRSR